MVYSIKGSEKEVIGNKRAGNGLLRQIQSCRKRQITYDTVREDYVPSNLPHLDYIV